MWREKIDSLVIKTDIYAMSAALSSRIKQLHMPSERISPCLGPVMSIACGHENLQPVPIRLYCKKPC